MRYVYYGHRAAMEKLALADPNSPEQQWSMGKPPPIQSEIKRWPADFKRGVGYTLGAAALPYAALVPGALSTAARAAVPGLANAARAAGPAIANGVRSAMNSGAGRAMMGTGRYMLNTLRANPKTTMGVSLGSTAMSALAGDSPTQQIVSGLTAPVEWFGGGAAAGALASKGVGLAGRGLSKIPGATNLAAKFPRATNGVKAIADTGVNMAAFSGLDAVQGGQANQATSAASPEQRLWGPMPPRTQKWQRMSFANPQDEMANRQAYFNAVMRQGASAAPAPGRPEYDPVAHANRARGLARKAQGWGTFNGQVGAGPFNDPQKAQRFLSRNPNFARLTQPR